MIKLISEFPVKCLICEKECWNLNSLSAHLRFYHDNLKSRDYSIKYLLNNELPKCKCGCGEEVKLIRYEYNEFINHHQVKTQYIELPENKDDWTIECDGEECSNIMKYSTPSTFKGAFNKKRNVGKIYCISCSQKNRIFTEKEKADWSRKFKLTWSLKTPEELEEYSKKLSEAQKNRWENISYEDMVKFSETISNALNNMTDEAKQLRIQRISDRRKEWNEEQSESNDPTLIVYHNKDTIPYIVDILNVRYDTEFRHGESKGGEYKLYDKELKRLYCADTYCKRLNLWIEFDEPYHFRTGMILREECQIREERIRICKPGITIHRIYFNKKNHNI